MAGPLPKYSARGNSASADIQKPSTQDPRWLSGLMLSVALCLSFILLLLPLVAVFVEALRGGIGVFLKTFEDPAALHAVFLTVLVSLISVPLNIVFGLAASWVIAKHDFPFKSLLITLIDLPFSVSPVVSGLVFVLLFGASGWFAPLLEALDLQVIFAVPGLVLATIFVTFPFVARELIPAMQVDGRDEEYAAYLLGANGFQIFWNVTLPNVRWALLYGVLLCNARAMGEFGAVSVVSGHIRGLTNTIPLHVEILYNEYNFAAAFSMAALLALLALVTLVAKSYLEWQVHQRTHAHEKERVPDNTPLHELSAK